MHDKFHLFAIQNSIGKSRKNFYSNSVDIHFFHNCLAFKFQYKSTSSFYEVNLNVLFASEYNQCDLNG